MYTFSLKREKEIFYAFFIFFSYVYPRAKSNEFYMADFLPTVLKDILCTRRRCLSERKNLLLEYFNDFFLPS